MKKGLQEDGSGPEVKLPLDGAPAPAKIPIAFQQENHWQAIEVNGAEPSARLACKQRARGFKDLNLMQNNHLKGEIMNPNRHEICQLLMVCSLAGGLTACATSSTRSKSARADRVVSFAKACHDPEDHQGARVLWGGEIQSVSTSPTTGTELMVKEIPLYRAGKAPIYADKSEGTFIARTYDSLDPTLFQPGEVITLTGAIVGQGPAGPEVWMDTVEFWELQREADLTDDPLYTDDYPFEMRDEPVTESTYHYVPNEGKNQLVAENVSPALTVNP